MSNGVIYTLQVNASCPPEADHIQALKSHPKDSFLMPTASWDVAQRFSVNEHTNRVGLLLNAFTPQGMGPRPGALTSPGNLWRRQDHRTHSRPAESEPAF